MPSVQCPQSSTLSPASRAVLPPYLQGEKKTAQCPLLSALSPVPSVQRPELSRHHTCREKKKTAQCPLLSALSPVPSAQCPQSSTLSPVPSVQCPQSSTLSPASRAVLPPYLQGEKKTAQCPLLSALSPVPSVQYPQSSVQSRPATIPAGRKKTASTGKNSKEKRAELRPEKKSKQPGSWPGAPPHLGEKKNFFKGGVGPRANQSRLLELFFQGEPLLDLPRDSIPAETDQKE